MFPELYFPGSYFPSSYFPNADAAPPPLSYPEETLSWIGTTVLKLNWFSRHQRLIAGSISMIDRVQPVRVNNPQTLEYTFKDENGHAIDLTSYTSIALEVKVVGAAFTSKAATFIGKSTGQVSADYTFTAIGIWVVQFVVSAAGDKLFGEPLRFRVVENVEDAGLNELLRY